MYSTFKKYLYLFLFTNVCVANIAQEMFPADSDVAELTQLNFETAVLENHDLWIIDFYAPWCGFCKNLVPEFKTTASAFKGIVKFGALNADKYVSIGERYDVTSYPSIKLFGYYKSNPIDYKGDRTFKSLAVFAMSAVKGKVWTRYEEYQFSSAAGPDIISLNDSNFNSLVIDSNNVWFVAFYAPWSNHSKAFLPHWRRMAEKLRGDAKFGILDGTRYVSKAHEYKIKGYPTIKAFLPHSAAPYDYIGRRDAKSFIDWIIEMLGSSHETKKKTVSIISEDRPEEDEIENCHHDNHDDEL